MSNKNFDLNTEAKSKSALSWKQCFRLGVTVFIIYLCINYWPVVGGPLVGIIGAVSPLIIGCIIAYMLNILMSFYEKYYAPKSSKKIVIKTRRPICLVLAIITLLAIISLVVGLVLPQFIDCIKLIVENVPVVVKRITVFLDDRDILNDNTINSIKNFDWQSWVGQAVSVLSSGIGSVMDIVITTVSSVFSGIVTAVLSIIFAIYILLSKETLSRQIDRVLNRYMSKKWYNRVEYAVGIMNGSFHNYIVGQCIEAVILGTLCTVGMLILRIPYAPMIGALIALTALIPIAGAYIGAGVGAFLILMESPIKALVFLIFIIILQQIEGNVIYPKVVGTSIGLPAIWVLTAVTIGGGIAGIGGMLLGVPLAASIYKMLRNDVNKVKNVPPKGDDETVDESEDRSEQSD